MQASQMSNWYQPIPVQAPLVQEFSGQPQSMLPSLQPHLLPQPQPQCGNFLLFQQMGPPVTRSMPPVSVAQAPSAMLTGGPPGVTQFSRFPVRVHQTYLNQMTQPINMYAQQPLLLIPVHVFQQQQGLSKNLIFPSYSSYLSSSSTSKHGKKEQVDLDEKNPEAVIDHLLRQDFKTPVRFQLYADDEDHFWHRAVRALHAHTRELPGGTWRGSRRTTLRSSRRRCDFGQCSTLLHPHI